MNVIEWKLQLIFLSLKRYQNMNGFMALMIGIGNQAVSRLSNTWEKLPAKYKKMVQEYETILVTIFCPFILFFLYFYLFLAWSCVQASKL